MLTLTIDCSSHQRDGEQPKQEEITLDTIDDETRNAIVRHLEAQGWVVQFNGTNMDTYCSKKCAE